MAARQGQADPLYLVMTLPALSYIVAEGLHDATALLVQLGGLFDMLIFREE
ncbi:MAG: hypothetical protein ACYC4U_34025 [Pirellulaceae bacterium]